MTHSADTAVMIVCGVALIAAMTVAHAQSLPDPTRPPASVDKPPAATDAAAAGEAAAAVGFQTVVLRAGAKPTAVINGEVVMLGGRVGDATVIRISEDSVTLKSSTGKETLELIPGVKKTPATKPADEAGSKEPAKKKAGKKVKK